MVNFRDTDQGELILANQNKSAQGEARLTAIDASAEGVRAPAGGALARFHRDDFDRDVWCVFGSPVDMLTIDEMVTAIDRAVKERRRLSFVTPNVNWLVRARRDRKARAQVVAADLSVADGAPVAAMARLLGAPIKARVAGSDIFEAFRRRPRFAGPALRVFLFGGRDGAAEAAAQALNEERGGVEVVGWINPGFGDVASMSRPEIIDTINEAGPDFILVALGAGKGQAWIEANEGRLTAPAMAHLGAAIDFSGGGVKRAPKLLQRAGLEWAWRIKEEPSLWRRYFSDSLALAPLALQALIAGVSRNAVKTGGDASVRFEGRRAIVSLTGACGAGDRAAVRQALRRAVAAGNEVELDLSGATALDASILGLFLMLEKHVVQAGGSIYLSGAGRRLKRTLKINGFTFSEMARSAAADGGEQLAARAG